MKEKHLYILGGVFVALFIIYFLTKPRIAAVNLDEIVQTLLFGFEKEDVAQIEVYKQTGDKEIRMNLAKRGGQWSIPTSFNAKAREYSVNRILEDLLGMTGKVRSSDPRHLETFKILDNQGIHVILKDEAQNPLANLIIGKKGEENDVGFVRFADKEKIYAVDKNILSTLGINGEVDTLTKFNDKSFIDLNAVKMEKKDLNLAALVANGREMIIRKIEKASQKTETDTSKSTPKEYEWVLLKGNKESKLDQKEVDNFFRDVGNIYAQEVIDQLSGGFADFNKASRYQFNRPTHYIVFLKENDENKYNILFGSEYEKDKGYYMNVQYDNLVYKVNKSKFDTIFKWVDEMPKKTAK